MRNIYNRITDSIRAVVAPEVPEETARCEFECRVNECTYEIFEDCPRRREYVQQGQATE